MEQYSSQGLVNVSRLSLGAKVLFATDDFFAVCENMIKESEPVFNPDDFTEFGKLMDGWETRRKRIPGHDWCIIKLPWKCAIKFIEVDTAYFTGNYAPKISVQAGIVNPDIEVLLPKRESAMGSACTDKDLDQLKVLQSDKWDEIVPRTALKPGNPETRKTQCKVESDKTYTHIRLNLYPDGGVARLRVYGVPKPDKPSPLELIDLASIAHGGDCVEFSNAHYGHPRNMLKPGKSIGMFDGWETARRIDRPDIVEANEDGTIKVSGEEWAVIKLGYRGVVKKLCIDTTHFKGNAPDNVKIERCDFGASPWSLDNKVQWFPLLNKSKISPHQEHWFECKSDVTTHIKFTIAPDGGVSRLRVFGCASNE